MEIFKGNIKKLKISSLETSPETLIHFQKTDTQVYVALK